MNYNNSVYTFKDKVPLLGEGKYEDYYLLGCNAKLNRIISQNTSSSIFVRPIQLEICFWYVYWNSQLISYPCVTIRLILCLVSWFNIYNFARAFECVNVPLPNWTGWRYSRQSRFALIHVVLLISRHQPSYAIKINESVTFTLYPLESNFVGLKQWLRAKIEETMKGMLKEFNVVN
jgi:hypothetical protein